MTIDKGIGWAVERLHTALVVHLKKLGTQEQIADILGSDRIAVNQLLNGRRSVSPEMALRLEAATGVGAIEWLTYQAHIDIEKARHGLYKSKARHHARH
jgi:addiction module HigA family antidote